MTDDKAGASSDIVARSYGAAMGSYGAAPSYAAPAPSYGSKKFTFPKPSINNY